MSLHFFYNTCTVASNCSITSNQQKIYGIYLFMLFLEQYRRSFIGQNFDRSRSSEYNIYILECHPLLKSTKLRGPLYCKRYVYIRVVMVRMRCYNSS